MDWQATELNTAWRYAFMSLVRNSPTHADASAVEASVRSWNDAMTLLNNQLARAGAFVVGPNLTLADIVIGLSTHRWFSTPIQRPTLPQVEQYYERLSARPGFLLHGRHGSA